MINTAKVKLNTIDDLVNYLLQKKFNIKIDEIVDAIRTFSSNNEGIFDDIEIYQQKTHSNYVFVDTKFPHNKFAGINAHNVGNKSGVFPAAVSQLIRFLKMAYILRRGSDYLNNMTVEANSQKWVKISDVEAKKSKMHPGGLQEWVEDEHWVDVNRPKEDGGYEECGRSDTSKGKKPVCVPANKAKNLDKNELENRKRQKAREEKKPNPDKKPNVTKYTEESGGKSNVSKRNIRFVGSMINLQPVDPKMIRKALMGEEFEEKSLDHSKAPEGIPEDPMKARVREVMDEAETNPKVLQITKDTFESIFNHFVKFADHYAYHFGFENGDQAVDAVIEDCEVSPNRELYLSYIGYLKSETYKELDSNSIRAKILALLIELAPEHNIFDSQIASTMVYGIASKLKDEFTD